MNDLNTTVSKVGAALGDAQLNGSGIDEQNVTIRYYGDSFMSIEARDEIANEPWRTIAKKIVAANNLPDWRLPEITTEVDRFYHEMIQRGITHEDAYLEISKKWGCGEI
jgi:hypothetical protein